MSIFLPKKGHISNTRVEKEIELLKLAWVDYVNLIEFSNSDTGTLEDFKQLQKKLRASSFQLSFLQTHNPEKYTGLLPKEYKEKKYKSYLDGIYDAQGILCRIFDTITFPDSKQLENLNPVNKRKKEIFQLLDYPELPIEIIYINALYLLEKEVSYLYDYVLDVPKQSFEDIEDIQYIGTASFIN